MLAHQIQVGPQTSEVLAVSLPFLARGGPRVVETEADNVLTLSAEPNQNRGRAGDVARGDRASRIA